MTGGEAQNDRGRGAEWLGERRGSAGVECGSERLNGYLDSLIS